MNLVYFNKFDPEKIFQNETCWFHRKFEIIHVFISQILNSYSMLALKRQP